MKPFAIWVAVVAAVFGGFAVITTLLRETEQVFVVVDSSFPMREVWRQVPGELADIEDRDDAEFALATEKEAIHSFRSEFAFSGVEPFAPCTFEQIESYPGAAIADERILITTPESCPVDEFDDWTIVMLTS